MEIIKPGKRLVKTCPKCGCMFMFSIGEIGRLNEYFVYCPECSQYIEISDEEYYDSIRGVDDKEDEEKILSEFFDYVVKKKGEK